MSDDSDTTDDSIVLSGFPAFPGNEVPEGYQSLLEEIVEKSDDEDRDAEEIAAQTAEQAIQSVFSQTRKEGYGLREPYKDMLNLIQCEMGRQGLMNVRRTFSNIVSENHSAIIEQEHQADQDDDSKPDAEATDGGTEYDPDDGPEEAAEVPADD